MLRQSPAVSSAATTACCLNAPGRWYHPNTLMRMVTFLNPSGSQRCSRLCRWSHLRAVLNSASLQQPPTGMQAAWEGVTINLTLCRMRAPLHAISAFSHMRFNSVWTVQHDACTWLALASMSAARYLCVHGRMLAAACTTSGNCMPQPSTCCRRCMTNTPSSCHPLRYAARPSPNF